MIRSRKSDLGEADLTQLVLTCLVANDRLLCHCGWIQAYSTQLHGDDLMLELAGNSSDDVRDKSSCNHGIIPD